MKYEDEHIERYLRNQLSEIQMKEFQGALEADETLADRTDFLKSAMAAARSKGRDQLDERFSELDKELDQLDSTKRNQAWSRSTWMNVAAVVLPLLAVGLYFLVRSSGSEPKELFATHFEPFPNIVAPVVRSQEQSTSGALSEVMRAYDQKDFREVDRLLQNSSNPSDTLKFYHAISLMFLDQTSNAQALLATLSKLEGSRFQEPAEWYLALSMLKLDDQQNAQDLFSEITRKPDHRFSQEATDLLQEN